MQKSELREEPHTPLVEKKTQTYLRFGQDVLGNAAVVRSHRLEQKDQELLSLAEKQKKDKSFLPLPKSEKKSVMPSDHADVNKPDPSN